MTKYNPGIEARLHLIRENRPAICVVLGRAVLGGLDVHNVVVVVADTTDPVGFEMADAAAEKAGLNLSDESRNVETNHQIPTAIVAVPIEAARALFSGSHPAVASGLARQPLPGCVRCVSIAAGAATLIHVDVRPTAPIASA